MILFPVVCICVQSQFNIFIPLKTIYRLHFEYVQMNPKETKYRLDAFNQLVNILHTKNQVGCVSLKNQVTLNFTKFWFGIEILCRKLNAKV